MLSGANLLSIDDFDIPLNHPMFMSISGKCGNFVFYMYNNKKCVRRHVVPRDPKTHAQIANRAVFASVVRQWQSLPPLVKDYWRFQGAVFMKQHPASEKSVSGYSLFISINLRRIFAGLPLIKIFPLRGERLGGVSTPSPSSGSLFFSSLFFSPRAASFFFAVSLAAASFSVFSANSS